MMFSMTLLVSPSVLSSFADHPNEETPSDQIPLSKLNTRDVTINSSTEFGFTNVKKSTGIIMKFCSNEAFKLSDCHEKYEGYTWTDRIHVLIYAPGWNEDSDRVEDIGESEGNQLTISTREARVTTATFTEDRKSTRLNSSHSQQSRMPSSA